MKNIEISSDVYDKLDQLAKGFDDTPNTVIERLIKQNSQLVAKPPQKYGKDYTKYNFNNHVKLAKNRLILKVVKQYVSDNKGLSFQDLETKFPKSLQGSYGVFDKCDRVGKSRFFKKPEELIQLSDTCIAVCTEWGTHNINKFIEQAKKLGFKITKAE